jgi:predicted transcriptional regulator
MKRESKSAKPKTRTKKHDTNVARRANSVKNPKTAVAGPKEATPPSWTFLTNYAHVLLCLAREPEMLMRDVATAVGITERAVQRIVAELEADGYLVRTRDGRRNRYEIRPKMALRHPIEKHETVASLLALVLGK